MTSTIKVNNIQNQCGQNIINENSNTITLGASGDTIALASGASQTGFGRTGTVDWQTGSIKTATFTAANGEGYFANTSGGAFTMNLPAGSAGAIVSVVDYTNTFQTNNLTITPNGSEKIGGFNASFTASTEGQSLTFVYVDGTEGWKNVQDSTSNAIGDPFLTATGGTITTSGDFKIHTFTGPGTFTVTKAGSTSDENTVSYMVVAGGGGGGVGHGGGGGAGGFREYKGPLDTYTASPLNGNPGGTAVTVTATAFPITVGAGGNGGKGPAAPSPGAGQAGTVGSPSVFSTVTSTGGGNGGSQPTGIGLNAGAGGSGGGSGSCGSTSGTIGSGNTPPVSPAQGKNGGAGDSDCATTRGGGGGGGAAVAGTTASTGNFPGCGPAVVGAGGAGATSSINGTPTARAGGGGGGSTFVGGAGGSGGGGNGEKNTPNGGATTAAAGSTNTGGGGGGSGGTCTQIGGAGGSGIVVIRYKFQ